MNVPCAGIDDPFDSVFAELSNDIASGITTEALCGPHAFIGALDDEETFKRAPKLSQVVASMVNNIKAGESGPDITKYAIMWLHWTLWRCKSAMGTTIGFDLRH